LHTAFTLCDRLIGECERTQFCICLCDTFAESTSLRAKRRQRRSTRTTSSSLTSTRLCHENPDTIFCNFTQTTDALRFDVRTTTKDLLDTFADSQRVHWFDDHTAFVVLAPSACTRFVVFVRSPTKRLINQTFIRSVDRRARRRTSTRVARRRPRSAQTRAHKVVCCLYLSRRKTKKKKKPKSDERCIALALRSTVSSLASHRARSRRAFSHPGHQQAVVASAIGVGVSLSTPTTTTQGYVDSFGVESGCPKRRRCRYVEWDKEAQFCRSARLYVCEWHSLVSAAAMTRVVAEKRRGTR
jgi:hypothetical protein